METKQAIVAENGEKVRLIYQNLWPSLELQICCQCGGKSSLIKISFSEQEYQKSLAATHPNSIDRLYQYLYTGSDGEIKIYGGCLDCREVINSTICFVRH
ncbi:MAG: hypothetical protein WCV58_03830 [Patescibacteria group bacterium]